MNRIFIPAHIIDGDFMLISLIRTILLYAFIILAVRIMGKRQISDMQTSELVITLVISDIAAIPMQNVEQPLLSGLLPILVLVSLEIIVSVIMLKSSKFRKVVCGNPVVIIKDGKILENQIKKLRISYEDLYSLLRQQEVFDVTDIRYGIVETNGSISLLKYKGEE
ncbi:MAG: DUF421 domain-containing protein [Eubacteriales bacterium]|nr:DUF421 domain-containing protein [Eubacteriales bacterium]